MAKYLIWLTLGLPLFTGGYSEVVVNTGFTVYRFIIYEQKVMYIEQG